MDASMTFHMIKFSCTYAQSTPLKYQVSLALPISSPLALSPILYLTPSFPQLYAEMLTLRHDTTRHIKRSFIELECSNTFVGNVNWFPFVHPIIDCFYYSIVFKIGLAAEATAQLQLFTSVLRLQWFGASRLSSK